MNTFPRMNCDHENDSLSYQKPTETASNWRDVYRHRSRPSVRPSVRLSVCPSFRLQRECFAATYVLLPEKYFHEQAAHRSSDIIKSQQFTKLVIAV